MGMKKRYILKTIMAVLVLCLAVSTPVPGAADDYRIEQISVNMPEVTVYYRSSQGTEGLDAYLGGEQLTLKEAAGFGDTGAGAAYYILLDVSGSLKDDRFADIKAALTQFLGELRENDQMILLTFGDSVEQILNGTESREDAAGAIGNLKNTGQNTLLFDAITTAADMIWQAESSPDLRRVIAVISDGKDCADDTRSTESVESTLTSRGIPLYSLAVENDEGDSEAEVQSYRSSFSALSRNTGGVPWTIADGQGALDGLHQLRDSLMGSYRAVFTAASNRVSNQREDFVLKFTGAGGRSDIRSVLVERGQKDETPPKLLSAESTEENSISVKFSEPVEGAREPGNYSVSKDGKALPVAQVLAENPEGTEVKLIFEQSLYRGDYELQVRNMTDQSNEKNAVANPVIRVETKWREPTAVPKPTATPTPTAAPTPTPEPEKPSLQENVLKWWPVVLTAVFLALIAVAVVVLKKLQKRQNVVVVGDQVIRADNVEEKKHIRMEEIPSRKIILWTGNGEKPPERMEYLLKGSAIVGRSVHCDICCDDPMMSKQHFVLEYTDGNIFISDLQSRNGTSVNGISVGERYLLHENDLITAGNLSFRIEWNREDS